MNDRYGSVRAWLLILVPALLFAVFTLAPWSQWSTDERFLGWRNLPEQKPVHAAEQASSSTRADTLPLLTIMVKLEIDMNGISGGIWRENYSTIRQSALSIANHAKIPKSEIQTIRKILGKEEFKSFVADDMKVHGKAQQVAKAAKRKDFEAVTTRFLELQQGCISCHRLHRSNIRESPLWN